MYCSERCECPLERSARCFHPALVQGSRVGWPTLSRAGSHLVRDFCSWQSFFSCSRRACKIVDADAGKGVTATEKKGVQTVYLNDTLETWLGTRYSTSAVWGSANEVGGATVVIGTRSTESLAVTH